MLEVSDHQRNENPQTTTKFQFLSGVKIGLVRLEKETKKEKKPSFAISVSFVLN